MDKTFVDAFEKFAQAPGDKDAQFWAQSLDDVGLTMLWRRFENVVIYQSDEVIDLIEHGCYTLSTENMVDDDIDQPFVFWPRGTSKFEIWDWFDHQFSNGLETFLLVEHKLTNTTMVRRFNGMRYILFLAARLAERTGSRDPLDYAIQIIVQHVIEQTWEHTTDKKAGNCAMPSVLDIGDWG